MTAMHTVFGRLGRIVLVVGLVACASEPDRAADTWTPDTGPGPRDAGWPEPAAETIPGLSLVLDGELLANGARIERTAAPARSQRSFDLQAVLVNRSDTVLTFSSGLADWIPADAGWSAPTPPPSSLAPGQAASFTLRYVPVGETDAIERADLLTVPITPASPAGALSVTVAVSVPRPNRAVLVVDGGWTATSDDGGRTWSADPPPAAADTRACGVTWGEGRFFRAWTTGQAWAVDGRYAWSDDGRTWHTATVADDFWPSECAWGMDRFLCVRGDAITWSETGATVVHEATRWANMLNTVAWTGEAFVAAGRGGRRVRSADGTTWADEVSATFTDEWRDIACRGATCVVVGGSNRFAIGVSTDGGATWADQTFAESTYARLEGVAWTGERWVATGISNNDPQVLWSADGVSWSSVDGLAPGDTWTLLGSIEGAVFGVRRGALYRSEDLRTWDVVLPEATGVSIRALTVEDR
jgi:hypothetical protein